MLGVLNTTGWALGASELGGSWTRGPASLEEAGPGGQQAGRKLDPGVSEPGGSWTRGPVSLEEARPGGQ